MVLLFLHDGSKIEIAKRRRRGPQAGLSHLRLPKRAIASFLDADVLAIPSSPRWRGQSTGAGWRGGLALAA